MPFSTASVLASHILDVLHQAGHTAYLVGGCVRDLLLDRPAKDFDVATSAPPAELIRLFPGAGVVGAHFGVVLVKEGDCFVEVATFRSDHAYRDGRRPEGVTFETDPRQDALRRDFTINAMMMDPRSGAVLDYAGGRADLAAKLIRTVGDPLARFGEDHLRLLRAVRFAARLGFEIEPGTFIAMQAFAPRIRSVSTERVREEIVRILTEGGARRGVEMLRDSGLLAQIAPEVVVEPEMLPLLDRLGRPSVTLAMAVLLSGVSEPAPLLERLRFSQEVTSAVCWLLENRARFARMAEMTRAELKRFVRHPGFGDLLALERLGKPETTAPEFSREELFPARLASGDDLLALGYPQGPRFKVLLEALETEQLEGRIATREAALDFIKAAAASLP